MGIINITWQINPVSLTLNIYFFNINIESEWVLSIALDRQIIILLKNYYIKLLAYKYICSIFSDI